MARCPRRGRAVARRRWPQRFPPAGQAAGGEGAPRSPSRPRWAILHLPPGCGGGSSAPITWHRPSCHRRVHVTVNTPAPAHRAAPPGEGRGRRAGTQAHTERSPPPSARGAGVSWNSRSTPCPGDPRPPRHPPSFASSPTPCFLPACKGRRAACASPESCTHPPTPPGLCPWQTTSPPASQGEKPRRRPLTERDPARWQRPRRGRGSPRQPGILTATTRLWALSTHMRLLAHALTKDAVGGRLWVRR